MSYIIGIDQSTQGTKAILTDKEGRLLGRADRKHRQLVNERGWISHDLQEIYENTILAVRQVIEENQIKKEEIAAIGISNQRETSGAWTRKGEPLGKAVVWQCSRAGEITDKLSDKGELIRERTGLPLSPYFPAAKMAWLIENQIGADDYLLGTIDSWLVYKLTGGKAHKTDYSNASRYQLFNLDTLSWDKELCRLFGVPSETLPQVCGSDSCFGETTLEGYFRQPIPIYSVLGDSHAALFAQGCHEKGMVKATYGTGSSIMMNVGEKLVKSSCGLASSLAWGIEGKTCYVLEGNINYTGAVITWLIEDMKLFGSTSELEPLLARANPLDETVLVPAFTGLSAPYWDDKARAVFYGMSRTTGQAEIAKAAVESIAYQITDVVKSMERDSGIPIRRLNVDGGPTRNKYLMQFQSDMTRAAVQVPRTEEFSALGAAWLAGIRAGLYTKELLFENQERTVYESQMEETVRKRKYEIWQQALKAARGQ